MRTSVFVYKSAFVRFFFCFYKSGEIQAEAVIKEAFYGHKDRAHRHHSRIPESVDELNHLLSEYGEYVIGRMGIPYREKGIHVISVAMDAPNNVISALSGKLGMLPGVSTKTIYGKKKYEGRRMTPNEREQRVISLIDRLCFDPDAEA